MGEIKRALTGAERMARFRKGKCYVRTWVDAKSAEEYRELALEQGYPSVAAKLRDHINTEREQWKAKKNNPSEEQKATPPSKSESQPES